MRVWPAALLFVCGCSKDPIKHDLDLFCGLDVRTTPLSTWGPALEPEVQSDEFRGILVQLKGGQISVHDLAPRIEELMQKAGVEKCAAVDKLRGR